jgi:hypothetical protein
LEKIAIAYLGLSLNKKRGESPFITFPFYLFFSAVVHAFVLMYFGEAVCIETSIYYDSNRLAAHIAPYPDHAPWPPADEHLPISKSVAHSNTKADHSPTQQSNTPPTYLGEPYISQEPDTLSVMNGNLEVDSAFNGEAPSHGRIEFLLIISRDGTAVWAIEEYSDYSPEITTNVINLFRQATYTPATKQGKAVNSIIRIEVNHSKEAD